MKQLVILSGKGGTGKTNIAAAFSHLAMDGPSSIRAVLADADVDAANLKLVMAPHTSETADFWGGKLAVIDRNLCTGCGDCAEVCRFEAIKAIDGVFQVDPTGCEGCAACVHRCIMHAIRMEDQIAGKWFRSESRFGPLFHAELRPGQENSGKLVTLIKQKALILAMDEGYDLVIVDGPPGIGCQVISAASGADLALIVVEPTAASIHDLHRILLTTDHFGIPSMVCINKADIYPKGTQEITHYCKAHDIQLAGVIPFDLTVIEAMSQGDPVTVYQPQGDASRALKKIWDHIYAQIREAPE